MARLREGETRDDTHASRNAAKLRMAEDRCEECGAPYQNEGGCRRCVDCGYSPDCNGGDGE